MSYSIVVDLDRCQGYANCLIEGGGLFDFDDETNKAVVIDPHPGAERRAPAESAVRGCPARAISIEEPDR